MPKIDLRQLIPQDTLTITVVDQAGAEEEWVIPPFDNETEHAYWEWSNKVGEERRHEQLRRMQLKEVVTTTEESSVVPAEEPERDKRTIGEVVAPMLAVVVKNVQLDADDLATRFHGRMLQEVADVVQRFFFAHTLPEKYQEMSEPPA